MKKIILSLCSFASLLIMPCHAEPIVALTAGNRLLIFDHATPGTITRFVDVSGLQPGELLLGIDYRPRTGELYAIGNTNRLYSLDTTTGGAKLIGTGPFTPALSGTHFGIDFNPTVDRIRVTSDADQNLRLNPDTGVVAATDTNLQFAAGDPHAGADPNVVGSAYTNNFVGATTTVLYDIDSNFDALLIQNPPNAGTLTTVGPLGINATADVGFDISGITGTAYASLTVAGTTGLYTINLLSGAATLIGAIGAPSPPIEPIIDIAVAFESRLRNISTRGHVGAGDDVLIGGFITSGIADTTMVIRGIGPSLSRFGVSSPLPDPVLTLYDRNGIAIATNDDWPSSLQSEQIMAAGLAPTSPLESAILAVLPPGAYTAIVAGKGAASGLALVEVYQLP